MAKGYLLFDFGLSSFLECTINVSENLIPSFQKSSPKTLRVCCTSCQKAQLFPPRPSALVFTYLCFVRTAYCSFVVRWGEQVPSLVPLFFYEGSLFRVPVSLPVRFEGAIFDQFCFVYRSGAALLCGYTLFSGARPHASPPISAILCWREPNNGFPKL